MAQLSIQQRCLWVGASPMHRFQSLQVRVHTAVLGQLAHGIANRHSEPFTTHTLGLKMLMQLFFGAYGSGITELAHANQREL